MRIDVKKTKIWYVSPCDDDRVSVEETNIVQLTLMVAGEFDIEKEFDLFTDEEEAKLFAHEQNMLLSGYARLRALSSEDLAEVVTGISSANIGNTIERLNSYS